MKKEDEALLKELIISRNLSNSSKTAYKDTIQLYTELQGKSLKKLLIEAEQEEEQGIKSKNRKLKTRLLKYRNYLQEHYYKSTIWYNQNNL